MSALVAKAAALQKERHESACIAKSGIAAMAVNCALSHSLFVKLQLKSEATAQNNLVSTLRMYSFEATIPLFYGEMKLSNGIFKH